jgi:hypothetical protein
MRIECLNDELNTVKKMLIAVGKDYKAIDDKAKDKGIVLDSELKIKDDLKKGK